MHCCFNICVPFLSRPQDLKYDGINRTPFLTCPLLQIHDTRPPGARPDFGDLSSVEKYTLPAETYETMPGTVLSWKKNQKLGRFDPDAASPEEMLKEQVEKEKAEIEKRGKSHFLSPPYLSLFICIKRKHVLSSLPQ